MATHAHTTTTSRRPATPPGTGGRRSLAAGIAALALVATKVRAADNETVRVPDGLPASVRGADTQNGVQVAGTDATLLALYAQHARNHAAVNALDAPDWEDEEHPTWLTYAASRRAVLASRPQTMEGVLAKARVGDLEDEVPAENDDAYDWNGIVVRDLLRVAGDAA